MQEEPKEHDCKTLVKREMAHNQSPDGDQGKWQATKTEMNRNS